MAYKAIDVANYIISYCKSRGKMITNIQVQKILYYIQAAFLVDRNGMQAFEENICAWKYGPVVEEIYDELKRYGSRNIADTIHKVSYKFQDGAIIATSQYNDPNVIILECDRALMDMVIKCQLKYESFELVDRTHEELPWKITVNSGRKYIDPNIMKSYFNIHKERIYE